MSQAHAVSSSQLPQSFGYSQLTTYFDEQYGIAWGYMHARPRQCFSPGLLEDLKAWCGQVASHRHNPTQPKIHYLVTASAVPEIFNLGGDLALFHRLISSRDREGLAQYAHACIEPLFLNATHLNQPGLTTITLVQGDALGGGFECALSGNVLVAERGSRMGFPEILFNLFPGMGALTLLGRRIGYAKAERLILSGRLYCAEELYEMGAVDVLAEPGQGEQAVYDHVRREARARNGMLALRAARDLVQPISHAELIGIADLWVEAALCLEAKDLRMMERLIRRQNERAQTHLQPLGVALAV